MSVYCKCGSKNCTLIPYNKRKEGAKNGGIGGAIIGGLIGLAGGPIGAIAGAVIGAGGGALIGEDQSTDRNGRAIETYKCNSCGKKFTVCPECHHSLETSSQETYRGNQTITDTYCKNCNNHISHSVSEQKKVTAAQIEASRNLTKAYGDAVKRNINNIMDSYDDYDDYD
ncbi:MAG: DUF2321 domain-containing protein [Ruminococcus sp.]|nr:DUF2321 domain-containing protein [Ruminococcus sp.]